VTRRSVKTLLAVLAAGLVAAPAASACPASPVTQPFAAWGDVRDYVEVPGGSFEEGFAWDAVGTPVLAEGTEAGSAALRLHAGDSITSPALCVTRSYPHLRLLALAANRRSHLAIEALWTDAAGKPQQRPLEPQTALLHQSWLPTGDIPLRKVLPRDLGGVRDLRVRLSVVGPVGDWVVDDVFVDPVKRG